MNENGPSSKYLIRNKKFISNRYKKLFVKIFFTLKATQISLPYPNKVLTLS